MQPSRHGFHKGLIVCLLIISSFGVLFAFALLAGAVTGKGPVGSILLGGLGIILLFLFVFVLAFSVIYWKFSKLD